MNVILMGILKPCRMTLIIFGVLIILFTGTAVALQAGGAGSNYTPPDLNVSGRDTANMTVPGEFRTVQEPIRVEITITDTRIPGPRGEMQAGPRSIGFTLSPVLIVIIILVIALGTLIRHIVIRHTVDDNSEGEKEDGNDSDRISRE